MTGWGAVAVAAFVLRLPELWRALQESHRKMRSTMFGLGPMELAIVGIIAVLLFGKRLPEVGRSLGKSIVEFKKGMNDIQNDAQGRSLPPGGEGPSTAT